MAKNWLMGLFTLGVLALALGMLVPGLMAATTDNVSETVDLGEGTDYNLSQADDVRVALTTINSTAGTATYDIIDEGALNQTSVQLDANTSQVVQLSGNNITVAAGTIASGEPVRTTLTYSPMYSWGSGPRLFMENIGLIIVLIVGSMLLLIVGKGVQR